MDGTPLTCTGRSSGRHYRSRGRRIHGPRPRDRACLGSLAPTRRAANEDMSSTLLTIGVAQWLISEEPILVPHKDRLRGLRSWSLTAFGVFDEESGALRSHDPRPRALCL